MGDGVSSDVAGIAIDGSNLYATLSAYGQCGVYNIDTGVALQFANAGSRVCGIAVNGSAVPEPSTYAAIAGAAVLGFAAWRRRQWA